MRASRVIDREVPVVVAEKLISLILCTSWKISSISSVSMINIMRRILWDRVESTKDLPQQPSQSHMTMLRTLTTRASFSFPTAVRLIRIVLLLTVDQQQQNNSSIQIFTDLVSLRVSLSVTPELLSGSTIARKLWPLKDDVSYHLQCSSRRRHDRTRCESEVEWQEKQDMKILMRFRCYVFNGRRSRRNYSKMKQLSSSGAKKEGKKSFLEYFVELCNKSGTKTQSN